MRAGAARQLPLLTLALAGWLWTPSLAAAAASAVEVPPGGVVRWAGEGLERCGMESNEWPPLAGACWYAVDLLHTPGELHLHRWVNGGRQTATVQVADYPYSVQHIEIEDEGKVNLSSEDLARARRESAAVGKLWSRRTPARFTLPLAPPLADLPAGGRFGSRRFFNGQPRSPHTGADYAATAGTPVRAVADGTVVLSADHFFSGNSVFIDHGDGLISMSFHLSRRDVQVGDEVHRGQVIGTVGATGRATGPHLHFGLRWRGARIDPALLLAPPDRLPTPGG